MGFDLEAARITTLPEDAFYISDFITEDEEEWLLQKVKSAPLPRWTQLSHRRLQTWPSALTKSNALLASPLPAWLRSPIAEPRFKALSIFNDAPHKAPNHVLVNVYQPGQGIMPHEDGSAYYPLVATVSLGAPIVLDLYHKHTQGDREESATPTKAGRDVAGIPVTNRRPQYRILQERRSLLITRGKIYTDLLHGIEETTRDEDLGPHSICNWELLRERELYQGGWYERDMRTSLTYRDVLHVVKMGNSLKFLGGR
ncbi:Oxoglutarate/iron-dependent dioxygenase [Penicillium expansum]|uniref:Oxoglutarate/iron-dependent dioxygenase n=1 Tax=Penicillium expansum TaxID=27334 RepID=A0A0A2JGC5_PENEN|nr:Oxoglutarate/iron-dependent dioxygenase [Penicillium expansum]KGO47237.1 Oxoglutarate/iron-dependent dioxygenase [Penicillium expansum]KGO54467.1 Oxoglutarate/iron-dependent dioxygenase [Penicillium expansum]KGO60028.1 Oxoglutarate/iron-dependent dioxygenase [Penicillium expansum]